MDSFVLTLAEARVMYRRYHSLLEKERKRLPGGEFWKELGTAFYGSGASPEAGRRRFFLALSLYFLGRCITDRPDFPHISPYFCQKVLEAGRDIAFCPVRIDTGKLSQYQKIYITDRSYEFAVRAVPPACLDFPETE